MEYREFKEQLLKIVKERLEGRYETVLENVLKNNGREREGLIVHPLQGQKEISPVIYPEEFYREGIEEGEVEECAERLIRKYIEGSEGIDGPRLKEQIGNWEQAKERVYPILLSVRENRQLLKGLSYRPMLDLAIVYIIRLNLGREEESGTIKVTNNLLGIWGITEEELYEKAMENLLAEPPLCEDLAELLRPILGIEGNMTGEPGGRLEPGKICVLTNQKRSYGASMLLNEPYLRKIAGGRNLFILPSSIHESLLLVDDGCMEGEKLNEMVRAVNGEMVAVEERLSDHSYYYNWRNGKIQECA